MYPGGNRRAWLARPGLELSCVGTGLCPVQAGRSPASTVVEGGRPGLRDSGTGYSNREYGLAITSANRQPVASWLPQEPWVLSVRLFAGALGKTWDV